MTVSFRPDPTPALARWASELDAAAISAEVRASAVTALADFLACTVAGARLPEAGRVRASFSAGAPDNAPGSQAHTAAFINAHACHLLEYDDLHVAAIYHPGAPTLAAALAVAERDGAGGPDLLAAIVAGYEVGIRLGQAAGVTHYRKFHTTGTVGTIGAAVACARLLGLAADGVADAIGTAATFAAGLWAFLDDKADSKPLHPAHAAMMGVISADLAKAGVTGARRAISGPAGFLATLGGDPASPALVEGLDGDARKICETTFKAYPCCGHTHTAIDVAGRLRGELLERNGGVSSIASLRIQTYKAALDVAGLENPATPAEARFSLKHLVACMLRDGSLDRAFSADALHDSEIRALRGRIGVEAVDALTGLYPSKAPARLVARLHDGSTAEGYCEDVPGSPQNPMSAAVHAAKFSRLTGMAGEHVLAAADALLSAGRTGRSQLECLLAGVAGRPEGGAGKP